MQKQSRRVQILLDAALVFLVTALLIAPLFKIGYLEEWGSIESTFIADARFLMEHWPHPQWQPLWYTGTRFDYIYPPVVRYGTALLAKVSGWEPAHAYHIFVAFFYCVGTSAVYLLARLALRSRRAAWLGAVAYGLMSPSYLILPARRLDTYRLAPHRLATLVRWGEGPHITAAALLPLALFFAWRALEWRRRSDVGLAALFSAAVVSTNFYGATALAALYPILVWSFWVTRRDPRMALPAVVIPAAAYGLTAFWLVPSYFRITAANMKYVAGQGSAWSVAVAVLVAAAYAAATWRAGTRRPERTWAVFIAGAVVFFSLNVAGNYFFDFRIAGEPHRWIAELDMLYVLGGITVLRWMWKRPGPGMTIAAAVIVLAAFFTTKGYVRHAWGIFRAAPDYQSRIEYKIQDWVSRNMPAARTQTSGSVRFWFDAWHDLAEMGGGSEQGLMNGFPIWAEYEIYLNPRPEASVLWLQCLGVDAVYVPGPGSQEIYKDNKVPGKFAGLLPVLYDNHRGDAVYQVPRRYRERARVVDSASLDQLRPPQSAQDVAGLRAYADVVENGPDERAALVRDGSDGMRVKARLAAGQSIVVQETYDPAWHAWSGGGPVPVRHDVMGFLVIDAPPGDHEVRLQFVTPLEYRAGRGLSLLTVLLLAIWTLPGTRARQGA